MHLVVDMQGAQAGTGSTVGARSTDALIRAILRHRGADRVTLACNALLQESADRIRDDFAGIIGADAIRVWHAVGPVKAVAADNRPRSDIAEKIREAFFESLRPDVVLVTSPFGGFYDDVVVSVGAFSDIPTVAVVHEWPTSDHSAWQSWRQRRSDVLRHCDRMFFLDEGVRQEAIRCGACAVGRSQAMPVGPADSWDQVAVGMLGEIRNLGSAAAGPGSSLVNVDVTGIFRKRQLRILAIKLDHLGDFLLSIPALSKLRARYPYADIDVVVGSWNESLARDLKLFRDVHTYDFFKRKSSLSPATSAEELHAIQGRLGHYDVAIDLRRQPESRFLLARISADLKVGYQTFDAAIDDRIDILLRSYRDASFTSTPHNKTPIARQMLRLVDALPDDVNDFVTMPQIAGSGTRRPGSVAIFPKAGTDVREWENRKFVELVERLHAAESVTEINVFFVNDREAAEYRFGARTRLNVHVGLPFVRLAEQLSRCHLCIANNSGGIHLASYLGLEVIGIYSGHELASEWGPQFYRSVAMHRGAYCAPCHLGRRSDCPNGNFCLADISVEDVLRTATALLSGSPQRAQGPAQRNDDAIVKALIAGVAEHLDAADQDVLVAVANAIASNHPAYSLESGTDILTVNMVVGHNSRLVDWVGFASCESRFRWTDGKTATMGFYLEGGEAPPANGRILLVIDTFRRQRIRASFNGMPVFERVVAGKRVLLNIPVSNLRLGRNRLLFALPDATRPANGDPRELAMAVRRFKIAVDDARQSAVLRQAGKVRELLLRWKS